MTHFLKKPVCRIPVYSKIQADAGFSRQKKEDMASGLAVASVSDISTVLAFSQPAPTHTTEASQIQ